MNYEFILKGYTQHDEDIQTGDNSNMNYRPWVGNGADKPNGRLHTSQFSYVKRFGSPEQALEHLKAHATANEGNPRYQLHQMCISRHRYIYSILRSGGP